MAHRPVRLAALAVVGLLAAVPAVAAGGQVAPVQRDGALIRATGNQSTNWSGYAETGTFTSVGASWTVPTATAAPGATTYASTWVGVDGLADRYLLQTGTESDVLGGTVHYDAWWEDLPRAEVVIRHLTVRPGDRMTASVTEGAARAWRITLTDVTTGATFTSSHRYRGPGASAEWIQERPQVGPVLGTLTRYGTTTFTGLQANGHAPGLVPADALSMVTAVGGPVISTPSGLSRSGTAFSVAYGPTAPPVPAG